MQMVFTIVATLGLLYFLFGKRRFDFFSVAFFSACVYFLPGFFGYALAPPTSLMPVRQPVELIDEAYWVMVAVLLAVLFGAICFDLIVRERKTKITLRGSQSAVVVATVMALVGFVLTVATTGSALLLADKHTMMVELNRWHIVWVMGASLGAVLSFVQSRWGLFSVCMALLLFDIYIGFRSSFAITLIAIFTLWISSKGSQRFVIENWRIGILGLLGALFIFIYKFLYIAIKRGDWGLVVDRLGNPLFYLTTIIRSEPFTTQVILNEVIRENFRVGTEHFTGLMYQFLLFAPALGAETTSFNDLFQPTLFPGTFAGMANNIWAEIWSSGGWPLLILFVVIFVTLLFLGSYLLQFCDPALRGGVALLLSYWAFYIHRNDILYQINLEKRIFLVWLICVLVSILFTTASQKYMGTKQSFGYFKNGSLGG